MIDTRGIPYIIESSNPSIGAVVLKHTNLTGGEDAYLGGELWFSSQVGLYVSGGSGRYPPANRHQLEEACRVFESFDYSVTSLGWDEGTGSAKRYWEDS